MALVAQVAAKGALGVAHDEQWASHVAGALERELLRQDAAHLDEIQAATASAREFALVYRLDQQESGEDISRTCRCGRST